MSTKRIVYAVFKNNYERRQRKIKQTKIWKTINQLRRYYCEQIRLSKNRNRSVNRTVPWSTNDSWLVECLSVVGAPFSEGSWLDPWLNTKKGKSLIIFTLFLECQNVSSFLGMSVMSESITIKQTIKYLYDNVSIWYPLFEKAPLRFYLWKNIAVY